MIFVYRLNSRPSSSSGSSSSSSNGGGGGGGSGGGSKQSLQLSWKGRDCSRSLGFPDFVTVGT